MLEGNIGAGQRLALHVLLVDADREWLTEQAQILESRGHKWSQAVSAQAAEQLFIERPDINLVVTDSGDGGINGLNLLRTLGERNQNGRYFAGILLATNPSLELAVQAMQNGVIDFLSKPVSREVFAAAIERAGLRLLAANAAVRTSRVEETVSEIQHSLSRLMAKLGVSEQEKPSREEDFANTIANPAAIHPAVIKSIIKARRNRQKFFEGDLFSDPSWDILLELTAAHIEKRQESVTSVAISASVPASTAIRKIRELAERGLVHRWTDPNDARRIFVALTDDAARRMMAMLASAEKTPII